MTSRTHNEERSITMTRGDAAEAFYALGKAMQDRVSDIAEISRKTSLTDLQKKGIIADLRSQHASFELLRKLIGEAFNIGGY